MFHTWIILLLLDSFYISADPDGPTGDDRAIDIA
jgi:hypothetical protein